MSNIINGYSTIKHLNIRKVGPEDDKVLALDIKFSDTPCSMELLARILGGTEKEVREAFWAEEDLPRFPGLDPITSWAVIGGCTVTIGGLVLHGAEVRKFKVLIGEKPTMEFSVSVSDPPSNATPILAELVMDCVMVTVDKDQEDLPLGEGSEADA